VDRRKGKKLRGEHLQNVDDLESFYRTEGRNLKHGGQIKHEQLKKIRTRVGHYELSRQKTGGKI
jgi:hypothetical protein